MMSLENHYEMIGGRLTVEKLVRTFYVNLNEIPEMKAVFDQVVEQPADDWWEKHIQKLTDFWVGVLGGPKNFRGSPPMAHMPLGLSSDHFNRWLAVWEHTCEQTLPEKSAIFLMEAAGRMRMGLQHHLGIS